jgi:uncharacterized membrane protein
MVVNHFPIIGTIFGLGILVAGLFLKNNILKNTAYVLFAIAAIFAFASMNTGEGAEEIVEDYPNIGHHIIHEHEELAEKFAIVMYVLGIASLLGLYLNLKNNAKAKLMSFLVLTVAIVGIILSKAVGTSGGEIRHTEIRENSVESVVNKIESKETNAKDED